MSIKVLEVVGFEYAIKEAIALSGKEDYESDSYWTYIENPQTLNRAKFEFFLGDKDKELILSLSERCRNNVLRFINVYYEDTRIRKTNYYALCGLKDTHSLHIASQLPYKELLEV